MSTAIVGDAGRACAASTSHGRVADHHRLVGRRPCPSAACDEVGLRLGPLDVGRGRPAVGEVARVEQVEVVLDLLALGRAGEDDRRGRRACRSSISSRAPSNGSTSSISSHVELPLGVADRRRRCSSSTSSPASAATSWSPPIPMWRCTRHGEHDPRGRRKASVQAMRPGRSCRRGSRRRRGSPQPRATPTRTRGIRFAPRGLPRTDSSRCPSRPSPARSSRSPRWPSGNLLRKVAGLSGCL